MNPSELGRELGRLGKGKSKKFSQAYRKKLRKRMQDAQKLRAEKLRNK